MRYLVLAIIFTTFTCSAQFDGPGGELGSKSVHKDATSIIAWASGGTLNRGYRQINDTAEGRVAVGTLESALGSFDGSVVSLGDGGSIILTFDSPIQNNEGYDFAVFENGFKVGFSYYLELAHVEVSENGIDYTRFPSECVVDSSFQTNNFSYTKPEELYNLAGKHQAPYGTLFDLEEIGLSEIKYIKLIDVVGSIIDSIGTRDSKGRIINEPFPSPFESGGFDLDAVAAVNGALLKKEERVLKHVRIYPSLAAVNETIHIEAPHNAVVQVSDIQGKIVSTNTTGELKLRKAGMYYVHVTFEGKSFTQKILIH
ncbi:MAG: hypothetical protein COA58_15295 [Bacteroidetes bacterium]|nr:MAG: hypothetical protein COA58_15295 [Bacteroidota bacterium]